TLNIVENSSGILETILGKTRKKPGKTQVKTQVFPENSVTCGSFFATRAFCSKPGQPREPVHSSTGAVQVPYRSGVRCCPGRSRLSSAGSPEFPRTTECSEKPR